MEDGHEMPGPREAKAEDGGGGPLYPKQEGEPAISPTPQQQASGSRKDKKDASYIGWLRKAFAGTSAIAIVTSLATLVNVPYLWSLGAEGWPAPGVFSQSVSCAAAFAITTSTVLIVGLWISVSIPQRWWLGARRIILCNAFLLAALSLYIPRLSSGGYALIWLWALLSLSSTYPRIVNLINERIPWNDAVAVAPKLLLGLWVFLLICVSQTAYSMSIFSFLPPQLGGRIHESIRLSGQAAVSILGKEPDGRTPPVWLVYEAQDSLWVVHVPQDDKTVNRLDKIGKTGVQWERVSELPEAPTPDERPRKWLIRPNAKMREGGGTMK